MDVAAPNSVWVFDLDGTILDSLTGSSLRPGTADLLRRLRAGGCRILLWSAGGADYARARAEQQEVVNLFDGFHDKAARDPAGRYVPTFLEAPLEATYVDDRPEDMPRGATVIAVSPYLAADPFDRGLTRALPYPVIECPEPAGYPGYPMDGMEDSASVTPENYDVLADLYDLANPQPKYKALLEIGGAMCPAEGIAVLAGRQAVETALRDPGVFTSEGLLDLGNIRPLIPLSVDPPKHVKYRKILDPLFAPKRMDAAEADITARFNHFVDAFVDRGSCHFTDELATPFPSAIFLGLMGLPWDELATFLRLKDGILRPSPDATPQEQAAVRRATGQEIYAYFDAILDERAADPRDDILTHFLQAEIDGERLTREEILDICFLFLIAGLDTVTDSLTCMFAFLAQHPDHRRQIAADPSLIPEAVEELLRWETPVPHLYRQAKRDVEVSGCPITAGSFVSIMIGAANVDPEQLPDGYEVRFDRDANRHLAFGGGVHRCLGSHLARRELRVALQEWHRRIPEYELKPGIELHYPMGLRSVENLELVW